MKILHTADWHLGHRLHEQSQYEEQELFLNWLENYIVSNCYDVLLISGDVFDTTMPSNQSLSQYYGFLMRLQNTCCKHIVITGGNHDSPGTLNAPKDLLNALNINVVGKSTDTIEEELFHLSTDKESVFVGAVPYLRDQDVRKAVAGESFNDSNERYKSALIQHYNALANACEKININNNPVLAMGHLFAIGGSISDSEKDISVGNLGHIGADDFPTYFDYVALGHLHRPQIIGGNNIIRYSGSPVILSFSEVGYDKKIVSITVTDNAISEITETTIPEFRNICRVKGDFTTCMQALETIKTNSYGLEPWIEIVLDNTNTVVDTATFKKKAELLDFKILKISLKNNIPTVGLDVLLENVKKIKTLNPIDVFKKKCEDQNIDLNEFEGVEDAFNEVLLLIREKN
ncbi:exonuclease subunit SbcD [Flavobacteriaceae bacterium]|nr:exonuclease subunit SbcD [Flavobacteriaceae bacterium]